MTLMPSLMDNPCRCTTRVQSLLASCKVYPVDPLGRLSKECEQTPQTHGQRATVPRLRVQHVSKVEQQHNNHNEVDNPYGTGLACCLGSKP